MLISTGFNDKEYPGVRTSRQNARVRIRALRDNANR